MRLITPPLFLVVSCLFATSGHRLLAQANDTLAEVQKRGSLKCGVSQGLAGFSTPDSKGQWTGIDVDFCQALAAAVLGDAKKVSYKPLSAKERFTSLQSRDVDLLSRNTTWTLSRDTALGFDFPAVIYYDGQGFMVRKKSGIKSAKELSGATICVNAGTTTELNLADYFKANKLKYTLLTFEKDDEVTAAYDAGRCDVITTDQSGLYAQRLRLKAPGDHVMLPEIISKEPLAAVVRHGDNRWGDVVRWTHFAMLSAEELGITQSNVDAERKSSVNPNVRRLLSTGGEDSGRALGLKPDWAYQIIKQVGNYGEVFERNVGQGSPLKIERGFNAQWNKGGLQFAAPLH